MKKNELIKLVSQYDASQPTNLTNNYRIGWLKKFIESEDFQNKNEDEEIEPYSFIHFLMDNIGENSEEFQFFFNSNYFNNKSIDAELFKKFLFGKKDTFNILERLPPEINIKEVLGYLNESDLLSVSKTSQTLFGQVNDIWRSKLVEVGCNPGIIDEIFNKKLIIRLDKLYHKITSCHLKPVTLEEYLLISGEMPAYHYAIEHIENSEDKTLIDLRLKFFIILSGKIDVVDRAVSDNIIKPSSYDMGPHIGFNYEIPGLDRHRLTLLYFAAMSGSVALLEHLIEQKNMNKYDPYHLACFAGLSGNIDMINYVYDLTKPKQTPPIRYACLSGNDKAIRHVYKMHDNTVNHDELLKAFLWSAWSGNVAAMNCIIELTNIDPTIADSDGFNILHFAAKSGQVEAIKRAQDLVSDPKALSSYGDTPLFCAAESGSVPAMKHLLKLGFKPKQTDKYGWNILFFAAKSGNVVAVDFAISCGIDPNESIQDPERLRYPEKPEESLITIAIRYRKPTILKHALELGLKPSEYDLGKKKSYSIRLILDKYKTESEAGIEYKK